MHPYDIHIKIEYEYGYSYLHFKRIRIRIIRMFSHPDPSLLGYVRSKHMHQMMCTLQLTAAGRPWYPCHHPPVNTPTKLSLGWDLLQKNCLRCLPEPHATLFLTSKFTVTNMASSMQKKRVLHFFNKKAGALLIT